MNVCVELPVFMTIVRYTYRYKSTFEFSTLVRTIVTKATIYFLVMVAAQTYIQLSFGFMRVWSPARFPRRFVMVKCDHSGVALLNSFYLRS